MRYLLLSAILLAPSLCWAQDEECQTDQESFWICQGDVAWDTGYLIPPTVLDLRECQIWEEEAKLIPELKAQRDEFQKQRDESLQEVARLNTVYDASIAYGDDMATRWHGAQAEADSRYTVLEVALIGGGTGVAAILVGMLIGALAL